jgi:hypothetical protein
MRGRELLNLPVYDTDGQQLGTVLDVRLVQDGPLLGAFAALRVEGLIVGRRHLASRLGYDRHDLSGPWLLRQLVRCVTRHTGYLPWSAVTLHAGGVTSTSPLLQVPTR